MTLLYSALFVVAGALLLGITYVLAAHAAPGQAARTVEGGGLAPDGVTVPGGADGPPTVSVVVDAVRADQLHELLIEGGIALAVMALGSVALGWVMAGRVLSPLRTMAATARSISAENLHERLAVAGPDDELKAMADTFDDVLARLAGAFEAQKQFVANASHELRTPLTLQQAVVDVTLADPDASEEVLRDALRRVRAAGQEQERLIDALLTLARSQRGLERREFVDLTAIVRERLPAVGGCRVEARLEPASALGDPQLIERLVVNLAENAVRHNLPAGEGGWVSVWTGVDAAGRPGLRIENSGPVIPADQAAGLFQPFRRLGPDRVAPHGRGRGRERDGVGLGLSIVAAVVAAHGGRVWARTRSLGGLTVEVWLPCCGAGVGAGTDVLASLGPALPLA
ncbi:HAMP domain-containing sensor histidine kinase [Streptomyces pseudovenezuelae]|uniref:HAMP domain-containing sensor histidine kinase n=1 Tax=Streptomyces pseudovenezuelae TaxID=67350 RepID=UPI002476D29A|nr:HAMP domain-containing sensor histidine kinase [Streptomyces pseudovenezuelae]